MPEIFDDYFIVSDKEKTTIKAKIVFRGLEKVGIPLMYGLPAILVYYLPIYAVIKFPLIILLLFLSWRYMKLILSRSILTIQQTTSLLKSDIDGFTTPMNEITTCTINEEIGESNQNIYGLVFVLKEGEKTAPFAFTSFNKVQEIIDLISNKKTTLS